MTDDDFERELAESDEFVTWEAEIDPVLATPLSTEQFVVDRRVLEEGLLARLSPERVADWNAGRLRYQFGGFDDPRGWGWVKVRNRDGEMVLGVRVHWSSIAAG
jgi:hypothetical protein